MFVQSFMFVRPSTIVQLLARERKDPGNPRPFAFELG